MADSFYQLEVGESHDIVTNPVGDEHPHNNVDVTDKTTEEEEDVSPEEIAYEVQHKEETSPYCIFCFF